MASVQPVSPEAVRAFATKYPKALRALENLVRTLVHADPQHALQSLNVTRRALSYISDPGTTSACAPCSGAPLLLDSMSACMAASVRDIAQSSTAPPEGSPQDADVSSILLFLQTSRDFSYEGNQVICHADESLGSFGTAHNASLLDLTEQSLTLRSHGSSSMRVGKGKRLRRVGSDVRSAASSAPTFGTQPSIPTPAAETCDDAFNMWSSVYNLAVVNAACDVSEPAPRSSSPHDTASTDVTLASATEL